MCDSGVLSLTDRFHSLEVGPPLGSFITVLGDPEVAKGSFVAQCNQKKHSISCRRFVFVAPLSTLGYPIQRGQDQDAHVACMSLASVVVGIYGLRAIVRWLRKLGSMHSVNASLTVSGTQMYKHGTNRANLLLHKASTT